MLADRRRALTAYQRAPLQPPCRPSTADRVGAAVARRVCAGVDVVLAAVRQTTWGDVLVPTVWACLIVWSTWLALRGLT